MMKRPWLLLLSVVLATVLMLSLAAPAGAITGGQPDTAHPNVGAVLVPTPDGLAVFGSGTLIADDVLLTAGHVTAYLQYLFALGIITPADVFVSFDQAPLAPGATLLPIADVVTHPQFNGFHGRSNPYDVGVVVLASPVALTPASLAPLGLLDTLLQAGSLGKGKNPASFTVVGYGATLQWPPPVLSYDGVRRNAQSAFQALLPSWLRLSQNLNRGNGGTATGDSGGPAFWSQGGTEYLVGITSWGDHECVATGFYYRVDTTDTLSFVAQFLSP